MAVRTKTLGIFLSIQVQELLKIANILSICFLRLSTGQSQIGKNSSCTISRFPKAKNNPKFPGMLTVVVDIGVSQKFYSKVALHTILLTVMKKGINRCLSFK